MNENFKQGVYVVLVVVLYLVQGYMEVHWI